MVGGRGQHRVQHDDGGHPEFGEQAQHLVTVPAAEDAVFVLDDDDVAAAEQHRGRGRAVRIAGHHGPDHLGRRIVESARASREFQQPDHRGGVVISRVILPADHGRHQRRGEGRQATLGRRVCAHKTKTHCHGEYLPQGRCRHEFWRHLTRAWRSRRKRVSRRDLRETRRCLEAAGALRRAPGTVELPHNSLSRGRNVHVWNGPLLPRARVWDGPKRVGSLSLLVGGRSGAGAHRAEIRSAHSLARVGGVARKPRRGTGRVPASCTDGRGWR